MGDDLKRKAIAIDCLSYSTGNLCNCNTLAMPTNSMKNKWIEFASSQEHISLNEITMLEESENIVLTEPMTTTSSDSVGNPLKEQKLPDFYELKIRTRKYDFL